jgi:hypothetical protein
MADPNQSPQAAKKAKITLRGTTTRPARKHQTQQTPAQAIASGATKYDVRPPPQKKDDSNEATSSIPSAHPSPSTTAAPNAMTPAAPSLSTSSHSTPSLSTPAPPSTTSSKALKSSQLLANVRAKFAEEKATSPSASTPSLDTGIQQFELTHLKTIKCDVCEQKNGEILYKCLNCPGHHQVCSRCVENTEPKPNGKSVGRKDWSVHAKLKEAHADYAQPTCLNKKQDGSYESKHVKFVLAKGKKSGVKKQGKIHNRRGLPHIDRNAAVLRALGANRNTEQGRRIIAMARLKLEKGEDQELRAKVAAARARYRMEEEAEGAAVGTGEGKARRPREKKRKADVHDEDDGEEYRVVEAIVDVEDAFEDIDEDVDEDMDKDEDADADQDGDKDADADADEDGDGDGEDEWDRWDPKETAIALEQSVRDMSRK